MRALAFALLAGAFLATAAHATTVSDPVGDFIPSYSGPHGADLDVVSTTAQLTGTNLILQATMDGPIGSTAGGLYVWGFDRGAGSTTANFAPINLPNIIFDSVVIVMPDGTGQVVLLNSATPVATPLAAGSITISGNTFQAVVPISMLPSAGFQPLSYTQNLWPRFGGLTSNDQISDFAPDSTMSPLSAPEPAALGLIGLAALGLVSRALSAGRVPARSS
jgi:hypothetical protein